MMRLWIDDERPPPDHTWAWATNASTAYAVWEQQEPAEISFDHDLGSGGDTRTLATAILGMAQAGYRQPPRWYVHSANPVGKEYLEGVLERADRYWRKHVVQANLEASYKHVAAMRKEEK